MQDTVIIRYNLMRHRTELCIFYGQLLLKSWFRRDSFAAIRLLDISCHLVLNGSQRYALPLLCLLSTNLAVCAKKTPKYPKEIH